MVGFVRKYPVRTAIGTAAVITLGVVAGISGRYGKATRESVQPGAAVTAPAEQPKYPVSMAGENEEPMGNGALERSDPCSFPEIHETPESNIVEGFSYPEELGTIRECAERVGVDLAMMMAIRDAEDGNDSLQFGIIHTKRYRNDKLLTEPDGTKRPYKSKLEKQAHWAALSIRNNLKRWEALSEEERSGYRDFIDFMGDRYSEPGGIYDTDGKSKYWKTNVRCLHEKFSTEN